MELGRVAARLNKVFVVDAIAGVGSHELKLDRDHVDFCSVTPNKALEGVPGIAYVLARTTALESHTAVPGRGFYLDLREHWHRQRSGQPAFTAPVPILAAFLTALRRLKREGYDQRVGRYQMLAGQLRRGFAALGLNVVLPSDSEQVSNTITLFDLPPSTPYDSLATKPGHRGLVIYSDPETAPLGSLWPRWCTTDPTSAFLNALGSVARVWREFGGMVRSRPPRLDCRTQRMIHAIVPCRIRLASPPADGDQPAPNRRGRASPWAGLEALARPDIDRTTVGPISPRASERRSRRPAAVVLTLWIIPCTRIPGRRTPCCVRYGPSHQVVMS